ncbi:MAG: cation-transporting P-type ATPase [bacterium]|nr:cation-transporting P-type ATPase [bacterium]
MSAPETYRYQQFVSRSPEESLRVLRAEKQGLRAAEVTARLRAGENRIPQKRFHWFSLLLRQFKNPFIYILGIAAIVSVFLGERLDAGTILVVLAINALLGFALEFRAERALSKLEQFLVPQVRVRRDGVVTLIDAHQIVPGDIILFEAGDIAAADVRLIEVQGLVVDETVLTGESIPVVKNSEAKPETAELVEATNIVFSGTRIRGGRATGVVVATGRNMVLGHIAHQIHRIERHSGFEEHLARFSGFMVRMIIITIVVLFLAHWFIRGSAVNFPELILFSLALAVAVVPEALTVVITLALSHGAAQLARRHVVVRRLSAMQDLGNIDVLCTDKTGTITENAMVVRSIKASALDEFFSLALIEPLWLARHTHGGIAGQNTFDRALYTFALENHLGEAAKKAEKALVSWDFAFDPTVRLSAVVAMHEKKRIIVVRGAPEAVLARCRMNARERKQILEEMDAAGKDGKRTFAVAKRLVRGKEAVNEQQFSALHFVGYATFDDPLKPTARVTIERAKKLGVDVRILTGDMPSVAFAIGKQIDLVVDEAQVVTGSQLREMSEERREAVIRHTKIFARVSPEEKLEIIRTLQKWHAVGFLGEGINDAPALELANAALVVSTASPVAREAGDVILMKRDLRVIIDAIAYGRATFENINKYLKYTLIGNFGNFYAMAGISLILPFVPLLPVQILLANLLTDLPLVSVSYDRVSEKDVRSPRQFSLRPLIIFSVFLGLTSTLFDFLFFGVFRALPPDELRTAWFVFSIITELALIFSIRSRRSMFRAPAPAVILVILTLAAGAITVLLPFLSVGKIYFHFALPAIPLLQMTAILVVLYLISTESVKRFIYRFLGNGSVK